MQGRDDVLWLIMHSAWVYFFQGIQQELMVG